MRNTLRYVLLVVVASLWTTLCFIVPDFLDSPVSEPKSVAILFSYAAALGVGQFLLLYVFFADKYASAVIVPIYALLGSVVAYYRYAFHTTVTPVIIDVTLHTNPGEAAGVMSWQLFLFVSLNVLLSIAFVFFRFRHIRLSMRWFHAIVAIMLFVLYYSVNGRLKRSISQRYPVNVVCSMVDYMKIVSKKSSERALPAVHFNDSIPSLDVVLVIGEAVRADHLSLNDYSRNTCPRLSNRTNIVSLPYIFSEHTHTAASVPHILTPADSLNADLALTSLSLISCFDSAGYSTAWISNQDYGHTYADFIAEADTMIFPNAGKSVFVFHPWYDTDMLPHVCTMLAKNHDRNLLVLHSIGSHWYYNNHVTPEMQVFTPLTDNRVVTRNTAEQVVNSYDNTVVYMDCFVDSLISVLVHRPAIVFYLSDHGESLGENGNWLHAAGAEETKYPAAFVWYSDKYAELFPRKVKALKKNSTKHYRTDYFFYSVLSAAGIEPEGNNASFDIFME